MVSILKGILLTTGLGAVGAYFGRQYVQGEDIVVDPNVKATGKVAIVTGSNRGIGKETAKELAKRGATVYMACRDAQRCSTARDEIIKETNNDKVFCRKCDLEDFNSIKGFVAGFKAEQKRLDILINNAAVMQSRYKHTPSNISKEGIEMQLSINHVGHFLLTNLLLDYLKKSSPSRIVVVTCYMMQGSVLNFDDINCTEFYHPIPAYGQSKLANMLFAHKLARMLQGTGVTVNSVNPGLVATEMGRHFNMIDDSPISQKYFWPIFEYITKSPYQGALTSIYAALEPSLEKVTGKYFSHCTEQLPPLHARSRVDADELWKRTEKLIQDAAKGAKAAAT